MKKLMNFLMLSCKKATVLIDKRAETKLSFKESMQLRMHKSMCDACTAYEKQSKFIDKALDHHLRTIKEDSSKIIENKELKKKIISKL